MVPNPGSTSADRNQNAFEGGRDLDPVVQYRRKDARAVWVRNFITPVRSREGEILQHFASFVDVTEHKKEEVVAGHG
jgi:PAS domain-containing protein